jgi:hypothetical protein
MIAQAAAAVALLFAQANPTPPRPCITTAELGNLAVVALPDVIDSFAGRCSAMLPETAFLRAGASGFSQRLRTEGASSREPALAAVKRIAPPQLQAQVGTEAGLKSMVGMLAGGMAPRLNAKTCAELSRFVESLSPLPAANVAMMFSSAAGFGMAMRPAVRASEGQGQAQRQSGPPICES